MPIDKVAALRVLGELEKLFSKHRVSFLLAIQETKARFLAADGEEVARVQRETSHLLFGGMGSLNDAIISRINDHVVDDEAAANRRLHQLREELWDVMGKYT